MAQMPTEKLKIVRREEGKEEQELGPLKVLCIGNGTFAGERVENLRAPSYDANDVRENVEEVFEVAEARTLIDATVMEMRRALSSLFSPSASDEEVRIFYYAGRGFANGTLAAKDTENDASAFSLLELQSIVDQFPGFSIIILDCCFGVFIQKGDFTDFCLLRGENIPPPTPENYYVDPLLEFTKSKQAFVLGPPAGRPAYEGTQYVRGILCEALIDALTKISKEKATKNFISFSRVVDGGVILVHEEYDIKSQRVTAVGMAEEELEKIFIAPAK